MEEKIKTVAIFMGLFQDEKGFWGFKNTPERQRCHSDRIKNIYQYDRDWNLLTEVVEKIESLYDANTPIVHISKSVGGGQHYCDIDAKKYNSGITVMVYGKTKIEAVYNACVEFINFYNKKKRSKLNGRK